MEQPNYVSPRDPISAKNTNRMIDAIRKLTQNKTVGAFRHSRTGAATPPHPFQVVPYIENNAAKCKVYPGVWYGSGKTNMGRTYDSWTLSTDVAGEKLAGPILPLSTGVRYIVLRAAYSNDSWSIPNATLRVISAKPTINVAGARGETSAYFDIVIATVEVLNDNGTLKIGTVNQILKEDFFYAYTALNSINPPSPETEFIPFRVKFNGVSVRTEILPSGPVITHGNCSMEIDSGCICGDCKKIPQGIITGNSQEIDTVKLDRVVLNDELFVGGRAIVVVNQPRSYGKVNLSEARIALVGQGMFRPDYYKLYPAARALAQIDFSFYAGSVLTSEITYLNFGNITNPVVFGADSPFCFFLKDGSYDNGSGVFECKGGQIHISPHEVRSKDLHVAKGLPIPEEDHDKYYPTEMGRKAFGAKLFDIPAKDISLNPEEMAAGGTIYLLVIIAFDPSTTAPDYSVDLENIEWRFHKSDSAADFTDMESGQGIKYDFEVPVSEDAMDFSITGVTAKMRASGNYCRVAIPISHLTPHGSGIPVPNPINHGLIRISPPVNFLFRRDS